MCRVHDFHNAAEDFHIAIEDFHTGAEEVRTGVEDFGTGAEVHQIVDVHVQDVRGHKGQGQPSSQMDRGYKYIFVVIAAERTAISRCRTGGVKESG